MFYTSNLFSLKLIQTALFNYKSASDFSNLNPGSMSRILRVSLRRSTSGEGHSHFFSGVLVVVLLLLFWCFVVWLVCFLWIFM